jgi:hypothetical protein
VDFGYALLALGVIGLPLLLAWKLLGGSERRRGRPKGHDNDGQP